MPTKRLIFQRPKLVFLLRFYCNDLNKPARRNNIQNVQKKPMEEEINDVNVYKPEYFNPAPVRYWNEKAALKKEIRTNSFPQNIQNSVELIRFLQSWNNFPTSFQDLIQLLKKRNMRKQLILQKYLPRRVAALKADLAAAHFLVQRGGSVKFFGNPEWVGIREKNKQLPIIFVPGMFIEKIKAENTSLYCEGLENLSNLQYLSYLSLKNLDTVNDWFLDRISYEHHINLKHLDISGCKNVTYRGLSCFYRFENLQVLEVEGIPHTTEFKLGCLMLLEIKPFLDIRGIDLSVPKEIKSAKIEENNKISAKV